MNLFEQILSEASLLLEKQNEVTVEKIRDAIENGKIVSMMYNDKQGGGGKSWRYIYPVVYGELKDRKTGGGTGNMAVRAYQPQGSTKRGKPAWKLFRLDRIVAWYNQENTDTDKTHTFSKEALGQLFNTEGDKYFHTISFHSPFMKVEYLIDSEPIKKDDIKQEPNVTDNEPEKASVRYIGNGISLDNDGNVSYNSEKANTNKLTAPETEPVTDMEVNQGETQNTQKQDNEKLTADEKPVTKDELEPQNDLSDAYNDLMNRWKKNDEENNSYV